MAGDLIALDQVAARALTNRIREAAENLWALLAEAHDRRAWAALGYLTFKAYVETEFGMTDRNARYLVTQARVIEAVTEASGSALPVQVSAREATDLHPHLDRLVENVRDATVETDPELKAEAARAAIEQTRQAIQAEVQATEPEPEPAPPEPRPTPTPVTKPDLGGGVSHPARYSDELLPIFAELLEGHPRVLDPFAGTGKIHELEADGFETWGIEIEPEWAQLASYSGTVEQFLDPEFLDPWPTPCTLVGSALQLPFDVDSFDAICTSPTYGNRLADHHDARDDSVRRSYTHDLGRPLHPENSGVLHWGIEYRAFHEKAWQEAVRVLAPGGRFVLNISDHYRDGKWQDVVAWHARALWSLGLQPAAIRPVVTRRLRQGENATRVPAEMVLVFDKERA